MAEEYFDVLNEKGDITGVIEAREKCHKAGLWHKAVALYIINAKEEVLLQKRSTCKKMWANMWDTTAGGHVLAGELGFQAIIRECKEELGVELNKNDITFIGACVSTNRKGDMIDNHFNEYYIANKEIDETKLKLQEEEVIEVKWIDKDKIIEKIKSKDKEITDKEGCWNYLIKYYEWLDKNR